MNKVRFFTWYWGNYCLATDAEIKELPEGFELYDEEKHGWENSDEFKFMGEKKFPDEEGQSNPEKLSAFLKTAFYINGHWKKYYKDKL